jgi:hypothetical protein
MMRVRKVSWQGRTVSNPEFVLPSLRRCPAFRKSYPYRRKASHASVGNFQAIAMFLSR